MPTLPIEQKNNVKFTFLPRQKHLESVFAFTNSRYSNEAVSFSNNVYFRLYLESREEKHVVSTESDPIWAKLRKFALELCNGLYFINIYP